MNKAPGNVMVKRQKCQKPAFSCFILKCFLFSNSITSVTFNHIQHTPDFEKEKERPLRKRLLKTFWEKEKILVSSIFSFSHNVFYSLQTKFQIFIHIYFVVCECLHIWISLRFGCWVRCYITV